MPTRSLIPIAFASRSLRGKKPVTILAGDIGGTKTNLALYRADSKSVIQLREGRYASREYKSLAEIVTQFAGDEWPDRICMAVAGPVLNGKVKLTNLSWELDSEAMSSSLRIPVIFINDLEANAYGLAGLQAHELAAMHPGNLSGKGNIAIISAGTGLGEAGMFYDGKRYHPFATEGGHCDFAPRTEQDLELWRFLSRLFGHMSWERVVSGPGIHAIFNFLTTAEQKPVPDWLQEQLRDNEDPAAVISNAALNQHEPVCQEALALFSRYLAIESSNLVLKLKATGGCYLGGGIAPKLLPLLQNGEWYQNFIDAGRMKPLLQQVPVYVITNSKTALLGAAYYGVYSMQPGMPANEAAQPGRSAN